MRKEERKMKTIEDMPEAAEDHAGFILTDRTVAALSQLDPVERDQVGLGLVKQ